MKPGNWQARFGAARRALDRRLLAEWERNYGDMPLEGPQTPQDGKVDLEATKTAAKPSVDRGAIARAFGRPLN